MCRSIKQLRGIDASDEELSEAARQFVRKVSGFREPSRANTVAFNEAIAEIEASTKKLLATLVTPARRA